MKEAATTRMRLCIHPVPHTSRIAASTSGYPVRPWRHAWQGQGRRGGGSRQGAA